MTQLAGQPASPEAQAAKLRGILESAVTAIITIDDGGLIESTNPATERLFGYAAAELIGQNVKMLMPEPYEAEHDGYITNYLETGVKKIIGIGREVSGRRKDGTTFPLHLSVSQFSADGRRYFTGIIHDLSDRKHIEEALRESERRLAQAQKMEAVGQLTGGIAHDFNNLLLVIAGNHELLELQLDRDEQKVLLKEAQDAAMLGSKLTDQLLTFARRRHTDAQIIQLNDQVVGITEEKSRGTGLGLAMVYGFVKQAGGQITIYSEPGHGTTFNLYFPRVDGAASGHSAKNKSTADPEARETILIVEDDERVRQLTVTRLKLIGYQVLEASDGPKALDLLTKDHPVDLVFTDLVMPGGMSGREVASRARQLRPGIKVLLTSGYAEELVHGDDLEREQLKLLRKPYHQAELVSALREVLATTVV